MGLKYQIYRVNEEIEDLHNDRRKGKSVTRSKRQLKYWRERVNWSINHKKGTAELRMTGIVVSQLARDVLDGKRTTADALAFLRNPERYAEVQALKAWGQSESVQAYTAATRKLVSLNGAMSVEPVGSAAWVTAGAKLAALVSHPDVESWGAMVDMPPEGTPNVTGNQFGAVYPAAVRNVEAWKAHVAGQAAARADDTAMRQAGDRSELIASLDQALTPAAEIAEYLDRPDSSIPWLTVGAVAAGVVGVGVVGWIVLRGK